MKNRLNYEECREKIFKLFEEKRFVTRTKIFEILNLNPNSVLDDNRFKGFLCHTRKWAFKEYYISKKKLQMPKIMNYAYFKNKEGSIKDFIKFCENNRIPYLYYITQQKAYIFIEEEELFDLVSIRQVWISVKGFFNSMKTVEEFQFPKWSNLEDFRDWIKKYNKEYDWLCPDLLAIIKKYYIFGESRKQMNDRINFKKEVQEINEKMIAYFDKVIDIKELQLL